MVLWKILLLVALSMAVALSLHLLSLHHPLFSIIRISYNVQPTLTQPKTVVITPPEVEIHS
jgi:hypothetical protein